MKRTETAIFTNMCMIENGRGEVLVQNRQKADWAGITFPGGHVESGESFHHSVIREVLEETGLTIEQPQLCGTKQFQLKDGTRYVVLMYKVQKFTGELSASAEGDVFWLNPTALKKAELAPNFAEMLEVFRDDTLQECYYDKIGKIHLL